MCLGKVKVTFTTHTPTMVAAVIVPRPPWCPPPQHGHTQQLANMLRDKSVSLNY